MNYPLDSTSTYPQKRASLGFAGLQVTTSNDDGTDENKIELDPNEYTARPGNAHLHTEFLTGISSAGTSQDADSTPSPEPVPSSTADDLSGLSRPLTVSEKERLGQLDKLKFFLATAPSRWDVTNPSLPQHDTEIGHSHPSLNRFALPSQEYVTCVLWNGIYHITGTDIVRALVFRFEAFGRPVKNMKKFEEGIFSDLRNLKPGVDACLEEPKSPFLDLLFKYQCIRTQKKQKVFYWFSVPHDRLFLDALERDLKREKMGLEPTTVVAGEPAQSFRYDPKRTLYDQFVAAGSGSESKEGSAAEEDTPSDADGASTSQPSKKMTSPFFSLFNLFEGSPTYKQRRKKTAGKPSSLGLGIYPEPPRGRTMGMRYDPMPGSLSLGHERMHPFGVGMGMRVGVGDYGYREHSVSSASDADDEGGLTAADMFMRQARGNMLVDSDGGPRRSYYRDQNGFNYARPRSLDPMQRQVFPGEAPLPTSAGYDNMPYGQQQPPPFEGQLPPVPQPGMIDPSTGMAFPMGAGPVDSKKVFMCPLFSCGRLFKRMEHLKRHLRTHTMERPFMCPICKKRFSRSDNLNQHLRTHMRDGTGASLEGIDLSAVDGYTSAPGNLGMSMGENTMMWDPSDSGAGSEAEESEAGPSNWQPTGVPGVDMNMYDASGTLGMQSFTPDVGMNMEGHEERMYAPPASAPVAIGSNDWGRSRYGSHSSNSSVSSWEDFGTSMSAPSNKPAFDRGALYPPDIMEASTAGGPMRRHRSVTPSVMGEPIRRPMTASSHNGDFPSPALPAARLGYHPYPPLSRSSSTHSSPAVYPTNLPMDYPTRSVSRGSSLAGSDSSHGLQDQMQQMMNLSGTGGGAGGDEVGVGAPPDVFQGNRTDSPGQFGALTGSPAHFATDLPGGGPGQQQQQQPGYAQHAAAGGSGSGGPHHAATVSDMFMNQGTSGHVDSSCTGYYPQPHHTI